MQEHYVMHLHNYTQVLFVFTDTNCKQRFSKSKMGHNLVKIQIRVMGLGQVTNMMCCTLISCFIALAFTDIEISRHY